MRRVLVTGGAGFIGSHLVRRLLEDGDEVVVLDDLSTGRRSNLDGVEDRVEYVVGDLLSEVDVLEAAAGCQVIFHLAALPSVGRSIEDPLSSHEAAATGTLLVLDAARRTKVKRVVYAASSSAYGASEKLPKHEDDCPSPISPYAVAKLAGEYYCRVYAQVYGLETVSLRYFNVFGPRQDPESPYAAAIPRFIARLLAGEAPVIYGDGAQSRDFTYVDNVVEANVLASRAGRLRGEVVNVACGKRITLNALVAFLNELLGTRIEPRHEPARRGDVRHSEADLRRAKDLIGYEPIVDTFEGLRRTVEWFLHGEATGSARSEQLVELRPDF